MGMGNNTSDDVIPFPEEIQAEDFEPGMIVFAFGREFVVLEASEGNYRLKAL